jgi:beta-glucanase (GH16 family)
MNKDCRLKMLTFKFVFFVVWSVSLHAKECATRDGFLEATTEKNSVSPIPRHAHSKKLSEEGFVKGRKLLWSDEFNGTALNTNIWSRCNKGSSDWNRHMSLRPDLVQVKDGKVIMWGVNNNDKKADPRPFLTGGIHSRGKAFMGLGKVEMRVKFDDHQKGAWPALWMCGEKPDRKGRYWPWNGEIDIVERLNGDAFVYHTVHSGWTYVKKKKHPRKGSTARINKGEWNIYGFEITKTNLIWSVNGVETFKYKKINCKDPDQWPFERDFYFLLDMQLGGSWVGKVNRSTLPVKMEIDWIRVYE